MSEPEVRDGGYVFLAATVTPVKDGAAEEWSFDQVGGDVRWVNHTSDESGSVPFGEDCGFAECMKVIGQGAVHSLQIHGFVVWQLPAVWVERGLDQLTGAKAATVGSWRWERTGTRWRCWGTEGRPATSEDAATMVHWAAAEFLSVFNLYRSADLGLEGQRDWSRLTHLTDTYFSACRVAVDRSVHGVALHAFREYLRSVERGDPDEELFGSVLNHVDGCVGH